MTVSFLGQILLKLAQIFVETSALGEFAGAFVFNDDIAVQRIFDSAEASGMTVTVKGDAGYFWQERVEELFHFDLQFHFAARALGHTPDCFGELLGGAVGGHGHREEISSADNTRQAALVRLPV